MSRRASQALLGLLTHSYKFGIFYYLVGPARHQRKMVDRRWSL
jgi:hypothetical protein